ncbi:unnamed protein product [Rotaria sp. Silwood2]|nr:unnamed protein product [Rotaria sp. Silwood2]CAF3152198.1 unnamed protein product [Rotaria sp. Silwood2]CAF4425153.1 unnamed protein product [Rotaria sp. Silwood2]CAF4478998.1 unnamed protein product [Rotaria sp. Silwood2]
MPNLYELIIDIFCFNENHKNRILYGHLWEKIIRHNLPNLQIFRFRMQFNLIDEKNYEQRIDEIINSFRSLFWLEEHKWCLFDVIEIQIIFLVRFIYIHYHIVLIIFVLIIQLNLNQRFLIIMNI